MHRILTQIIAIGMILIMLGGPVAMAVAAPSGQTVTCREDGQ